jgi:polysaccharide export outer membrane protein
MRDNRLLSPKLTTALFVVATSFLNFAARGQTPAVDAIRYHLGPGDVIDIRVFGRPQLSADAVRIGEDGQIRLPMISRPIQAACHTEEELSQTIARDYSEYLVDPQVSVGVREYSSQIVNLTGSVQKPGSFQLQRRVRLRELIALAGGTTETVGDTILIVRDERRASCEAPSEAGVEAMKVVKTEALLQGEDASNPYVLPGDFINATQAQIAFVVGNVFKPSPIPLSRPVSLTTALAMAGGKLPGSRNNIHIIRRAGVPQGNISVLQFSIKDILGNRQEDPILKPGDIVDVDVSFSKALLKTTAMTVTSLGSLYYPLTYIK